MRIVIGDDGKPRNTDENGNVLPNGDEFTRRIIELDGWEREKEILRQLEAGNIPAFLRDLKPVEVKWTENGVEHSATYYAMPDYLAIGTDDNYVRIPMTMPAAQIIADHYGMSLPTAHMVDQIYGAASVKLTAKDRNYYLEGKGLPSSDAAALRAKYGAPPFDWSGEGGAQPSTASYHEQSRAIDAQVQERVDAYNRTTQGDRKDHLHAELIAGHGKDLIITPTADPNAIQFYGWYKADGTPIQAEGGRGNGDNGHKGDPDYVDYSHKVRLIGGTVEVDGRSMPIGDALKDPATAKHLVGLVPFSDAHPPRVPEKNMEKAAKHGLE